MDPDKTLAEIRQITSGPTDPATAEQDFGLLVEKVEALDEWLSRGGFSPSAWGIRRNEVVVPVAEDRCTEVGRFDYRCIKQRGHEGRHYDGEEDF